MHELPTIEEIEARHTKGWVRIGDQGLGDGSVELDLVFNFGETS